MGWRKKDMMTQAKTTPHLMSSGLSVMGYMRSSFGISTTSSPTTCSRTRSARASQSEGKEHAQRRPGGSRQSRLWH